MVALSRTRDVLRYCRGMVSSWMLEVNRCTAWFPTYATSSTNWPGSCRCTLKFQRSEYGLRACELKIVIPCPRNVPAPLEDPEGCRIPPGNGLESELAGVTKLSLVATNCVVWLKPDGFRPVMPMGTTNTPRPPRITVLPPSAAGVHAAPRRGLKILDLLA